MSELRRDPFSGRWVVIAAERSNRPTDFRRLPRARGEPADCPFCSGNERETPDTTALYRFTADGPWQVRVIPNKYPAVRFEPTPRHVPGPFSETRWAGGLHEVIVESPSHIDDFADLTGDQVRLAFHAYRDRLQYGASLPELTYGVLFKNCGVQAGASLAHVHSQFLAIPFLPHDVATELRHVQDFQRRHGECLTCALLRHEAAGPRIVATGRHCVAICPHASRWPYETWIIPLQHAAHFAETPDEVLAELADLTLEILCRFSRQLDRPDYNFYVRTAPFRRPDSEPHDAVFHWRFELFPRLANVGGYELGSGEFLNIMPPEKAAEGLACCSLPASQAVVHEQTDQ